MSTPLNPPVLNMGRCNPLPGLGKEDIETFLDKSLRFTSIHETPGIITMFLVEILEVETMLTRARQADSALYSWVNLVQFEMLCPSVRTAFLGHAHCHSANQYHRRRFNFNILALFTTQPM